MQWYETEPRQETCLEYNVSPTRSHSFAWRVNRLFTSRAKYLIACNLPGGSLFISIRFLYLIMNTARFLCHNHKLWMFSYCKKPKGISERAGLMTFRFHIIFSFFLECLLRIFLAWLLRFSKLPHECLLCKQLERRGY